jgi:AsmA protein
LVLAGLCAALILPFLISADTVRETVQGEIRSVTGLNPVLRGKTAVSLFPTASVSFEDISLDDNRTGAPTLTAERALARLKFFPLLVGRIEIADISLVRPTILVVFNEDRSSNWSHHMEVLAESLRQRPDRTASFSEIRIDDGKVVLRDASAATPETLMHVEFALAWPSISRSFAATGSFAWHDERINASISLTDFAAALIGERSGLKVRLAGTPFKAGFDGYISHRPTLRMEGTFAADAASLRDVLRWAGQTPPPAGGFGRFAFKAQTNVVAATIGFSGAHIELDDNVGDGVLAFDGRQTLQGTLAAGSLDLSPYVSTVRLLTGGEHGWDSKPINVNGLSGIDIDLRLSAARVTLGSAKLGRTAAAANLRSGHFTVAIGESEAFGGLVKGTLELARSPAGADLKTQLQFAEVDLDQCLGELFGIRRLEGKGNLAFAIQSSGASVYELTKALNGTATLSSRKGAIAGFNVEQLLRRIERRPLSGGGNFRVGKTPYETLTVGLKIVDGIANVENVHMSGSAVGLDMTGSASIPARELDLRGTASLLSAAVPAFELPFMVQGPWDDPIMLPDPEIRLQRSGAAAPLLDAVRNRGASDAVRSALERFRAAPGEPAAPAAQPQQPPALAGASAPADVVPPAAESTPAGAPAADAPASQR